MNARPRNANRFADDRLWDDNGRQWSRSASNLTRAQVEAALADPAIRVGLHDDWGVPLRWVDRDQRVAVWRDEVAGDFADGGLRSRHARKQGRLPYVAGLWVRDGATLLVFESD
ncbi:MAG: hypothetical protein ABI658_19025 [Acidimicrobiales bacterium]